MRESVSELPSSNNTLMLTVTLVPGSGRTIANEVSERDCPDTGVAPETLQSAWTPVRHGMLANLHLNVATDPATGVLDAHGSNMSDVVVIFTLAFPTGWDA